MLPGTPHTFIGSTTFAVAALECAHCRRAIAEEVAAVPGVDSVTVDPATGTVTVTTSVPLDRADIAAALEEAGHRLLP
jgi:copper chaperone CopZ